jgi:hypothetical protein
VSHAMNSSLRTPGGHCCDFGAGAEGCQGWGGGARARVSVPHYIM